MMTSSQETKEKSQGSKERVALTDDPCCDDSCCDGSGPSVSIEDEGTERGYR